MLFSTYNLIDLPVLTEMIAVYLSRHFTIAFAIMPTSAL